MSYLKVFVTLFALALASCASAPSASITIPQLLREPCEQPTSQMVTIGDLAAYSLNVSAALANCDNRRAEIVKLVDAAQKPKRKWWRVR